MDGNDKNYHEERRQAELDYVAAAFTLEEAWCCTDPTESIVPVIHRHLILPTNEESSAVALSLDLALGLSPNYPETEPLEIALQVLLQQQQQQDNTTKATTSILKLVYDVALSSLLTKCRHVANSLIGNEAVFSVLTAADDWIQETWPQLLHDWSSKQQQQQPKQPEQPEPPPKVAFLARHLIYSHHIVSKTKLRDLTQLAHFYELTGYVKTGWPGLIVIEGLDASCDAFYQDIKKWSWQYLVMRGEMREIIDITIGGDFRTLLNPQRRFHGFQLVSEMSIVAQACREANLEAFFRTSMNF